MANNRPWDFDEARAACRKASMAQEKAERALKQAYVNAAHAHEEYRRCLADKILDLRADGLAATLCQDLAKGSKEVSELRRLWDIAEGTKEAMQQNCWRHTADRKDAQRFADWSQRREMAETGHMEPIG